MMIKKLSFLLTIFLLILAIPTLALAESEKVEDRIKALEDEIRILKNQEDQYKYLKEDTKEFRSHVESEMKNFREAIHKENESFRNSLTSLFTIIGGILAILIGGSIIVSIFKLTKKITKQIDDYYQNKERELTELIDQKNEALGQRLNINMNNIEEKVTTLHSIVDERNNMKDSRVILTGHEGLMDEKLLNEIQKKGIQHLNKVNYSVNNINQLIQEKKADIIIFFYVKELDAQLKELKTILKNANYTIPLLIYADKDRVNRNDNDKYYWTVMANFPASLISHLVLLAISFNQSNNRD